MELLEKCLKMTNDSGKEMFRWNDYDVIGIEERKNDNWFYAIVRFKCSPEGVYVLALPKKDSGCKACIFSHLWYFALLVSQEDAGINVVWNHKSWPTWPSWICRDEEKLNNFSENYKALLGRYGFDRLSIEQNYYNTRKHS